VASLNLSFGGESPGGVYHSVYDSFEWYTRFSDTDFTYGRTLAQVTGTAVLRLSEAAVLPFRFSDMSDTLARYAAEVQKLHAGKKDAPSTSRHSPPPWRCRRHRWPSKAPVCRRQRQSAQTQEEASVVNNRVPAARQRRRAAASRLVPPSDTRLALQATREDPAADPRGLKRQWDEARAGVTGDAAINALAAQVDRASAGLSRVGK
jgi:hypothetical protein